MAKPARIFPAIAAGADVKRIPIAPRANKAARIKELDFGFAEVDGQTYWDESVYYAFTLEQIERDIEAPSAELAALCLELVEKVVNSEQLLEVLKIPQAAWDVIKLSWQQKDPSLYGRFDFAYDGKGPAKLLEYNADTPTSLYEASVFQWFWLEDARAQNLIPDTADQYNSLHEKLIARLKDIASDFPLHIASMPDSIEDDGFCAYLADCATQAGIQTHRLTMPDIVLNGEDFRDSEGRKITRLFKLYPWEWMFADDFGTSPAMETTLFLEPPWKAILSNKGLLPLLWQQNPGHPNLLPAFFENDPGKDRLEGRFVRKPLYSREGANVLIVDKDQVLANEGGLYGAEGYIRQAIGPAPDFGGVFPVLGSWIVGDAACGLGIREDSSMITHNNARFVPHAIIG